MFFMITNSGGSYINALSKHSIIIKDTNYRKRAQPQIKYKIIISLQKKQFYQINNDHVLAAKIKVAVVCYKVKYWHLHS